MDCSWLLTPACFNHQGDREGAQTGLLNLFCLLRSFNMRYEQGWFQGWMTRGKGILWVEEASKPVFCK